MSRAKKLIDAALKSKESDYNLNNKSWDSQKTSSDVSIEIEKNINNINIPMSLDVSDIFDLSERNIVSEINAECVKTCPDPEFLKNVSVADLDDEESRSLLTKSQNYLIDTIDENSFDVIETSQDILDIPLLPLCRKKTFAVLNNVAFLRPMQGDIDLPSDFSSGSDNCYIPSSASDTSDDLGDNQNILTNLNTSNAENQTHTTLPLVEHNEVLPSPKQKKFPPRDNKAKKRPKKEETWKKKSAAIARERGEEYLSYKNIIIPKKCKLDGTLCHDKCRLQCSTKFDLNERQEILNDFYSLDINSKNALLFKSILSKPVQRQRKNAKTHKSASYKYLITYKGETKEVCKLGLCGLYRIGRKKIDVIKNRIKSGVSAPPPDRRGKHSNRPHKIDDEVATRIKNHISSFPAEQSHYSRNKNAFKLYLSPLLNITKMHQLYLEMCREEHLPHKYKITKSSYNKIFVTEFNLSFGYPKSDTCSTCDAGKSTDEHVVNYHTAIATMASDRKKPNNLNNLLYITVDLQQTMPLPKIPTSKAFYLRQIWFYNLGIHVVNGCKEKAFCCTWTEDVADRGSFEVASALLRFVEIDNSCQNKDHLLIWSDSCAGQNKKFNMILLYQYMLLKKYFKIIDHKFPEVGHSYLDSDRDFGRIEKVLRKHESVYVPEQYREIITKSSRNNTVIDMFGHFRRVSELQTEFNFINRKKNVDKDKVNFRDGIRWIRVEEVGSYLYKENYNDLSPFIKVNIMKKNSKVTDFTLSRIEEKYGTISEEKKENIVQQLPYIPSQFHYFYQPIVNKNHSQ